MAWPLVNLGMMSLADGDLDGAEARCERARRIIAAAEGAECLDAVARARAAR